MKNQSKETLNEIQKEYFKCARLIVDSDEEKEFNEKQSAFAKFLDRDDRAETKLLQKKLLHQ